MRDETRQASGRQVDFVRASLGTGLRPYLVHRLTRETSHPRPPEEWVRFVYDFHVGVGASDWAFNFSLRPAQIPSEITRLVELVAADEPKRVLEVGSAGGGTLFLFARVAAPNALLVGMDLPPHSTGGLPGWRAALYDRAFPGPGQRVRMVRGDSHVESTKNRVLEALEGAPVDFLFIDADHTYEGVKRDFEIYAPLVRPGGLIGMHDIVRDSFHRTGVKTASDSGDVFRFWEELKANHSNRSTCEELVENPGQDGYGIGVLRA